MLHYLKDLFFPKVCLGCTSLLVSGESVICSVCRHEIPITNHLLTLDNEAYKKFYGKVPVVFAAALLYYHKKGIVQELIHNLKYRGHEEIGFFIADWFEEDIKETSITDSVDCVIPVPLHPKKHRQRGYNQVNTFGRCLSEKLCVEYAPAILRRNIYSKTQTKKDLLKRTEVNSQAIFEAVFTANDHNKHFLLIDDVLTTGSTLEACSNALLKIPGAKISILCMAMSH